MLAGMLTDLIIGVVTAIGFGVLAYANIDVLKAVKTVVVFTLPASPEKSYLLCCTPCNFWPMTALGFDRVLQTRMPSYQV